MKKYSEIVSELEKFTEAKRKKPKIFSGIVRKADSENNVLTVELQSYEKPDLSVGSLILIKESNLSDVGTRATVLEYYNSFLEIEIKENPSQFENKKITIDKDEINVILERLDNITETIKKEKISPDNERILDFIIRKNKPKYTKQKVPLFSKTLNENQKKSVINSIEADDFHLIMGPPGTGKTYVIEELIHQFLKRKQKILVTAWTNKCIDNIVKRLSEKESENIVRIGPVEKMDKEVKKYSVSEKIKEHKDYEEIENYNKVINELSEDMEKKIKEKNSLRRKMTWVKNSRLDYLKSLERKIDLYEEKIKELKIKISTNRKEIYQLEKGVASEIVNNADLTVATAVSSCHNFLDDVKFDVMIMDEASQVSSFMSLLPFLKSKKFILVGDSKQLQPIEEENMSEEMNLSIFNRLFEMYPAASNLLTIQHRMHKTIAEISSEIFYEGKLKTSDEVAEKKLLLNSDKNKFLNSENPVIFVDTSKVKYYEDGVGSGCSNQKEAEYVSDIVSFFINQGIETEDIAVITPYVRQKNLIKNFLKDNEIEEVEVDTVHRFQGREKDIIIMSFAKSKKYVFPQYDLKFIGKESLINVSITRARKKLILIGNSETICQCELLNKVINKIEERSKIILGE